MTAKISTDSKTSLDVKLLKYFLDKDQDPLLYLGEIARKIASADQYYAPFRQQKEASFDRFYQLLSQNQFLPAADILRNSDNLNMLNHMAIKLRRDEETLFSQFKQISHLLKQGIHLALDLSELQNLNGKEFTHYLSIIQNLPQDLDDPTWMRLYIDVNHSHIEEFLDFALSAPDYIHFAAGITDQFMQELKHKHAKQEQSLTHTVFKQLAKLVLKQKRVDFLFSDKINCLRIKQGLSADYLINPLNQLASEHELMASGILNLATINTDDETQLKEVLFTAIHFLDNCIELNHYPNDQSMWQSKKMRRICLGFLGLEPHAQSVVIKINELAIQCSQELSELRGGYQQIRYEEHNHSTRHSQLIGQCHQPLISQIAGSPSYLFKREMNLKDFYALYPRHSATQDVLTNIASFKHPTNNMPIETIMQLFLTCYNQGLLTFEI
jgi:hypothetical protein